LLSSHHIPHADHRDMVILGVRAGQPSYVFSRCRRW
jgi:hypothetical protein